MAYKLLSRNADTVGDGSGTKNAIGNYAGDPTPFMIRAQPGEHLIINRMIVGAEGNSFSNADLYGSGPELTVGISLYVTDDNGDILYYLTDEDTPIKQNGGWAHYCYDYARFGTAFPQGNDLGAVRWTFARTGQPVELLPGWSINVLLEDDMRTVTTGLVEHNFLMQGHFLVPKIGKDDGHA